MNFTVSNKILYHRLSYQDVQFKIELHDLYCYSFEQLFNVIHTNLYTYMPLTLKA